MNVDNLSTISRNFYESSRFKVSASLALGGFGLMLLGFSSCHGGEAGYAAASMKSHRASTGIVDAKSLQSALSGYGLSCFLFLVGAIFLLTLAIHVSPLICGSANEKRILKIPQELNPNASNGFSNNNISSNYNSSNMNSNVIQMTSSPGRVNNRRNNDNSSKNNNNNSLTGKTEKKNVPMSLSENVDGPYSSWPEGNDESEDDGNNDDSINVSVDG